MNIKRLVPDTITSCNLLCGAVAVIMATEGAFLYAFLLKLQYHLLQQQYG